MLIAIPSADGKLCGHFGHCENFTFVEVDMSNKTILNIEVKVPDGGISCGSALWVAQEGAQVVLAGGMGGRPLAIFAENNVKVIAGCPEMSINDIVNAYLSNELIAGENSCGGGEHHNCHGHNCHH